MKIIYTDVARKPDLERELGASYLPLENLLKEADFITLHAPLTAETYHLIGPKEFEAMKSSAVLINCARGAMVDPEALYSALVSGRIRHAALDVTEPEPINEDSPFMELENLTLAPHIASASYHARQKMAMMAADNLEAGLAGEKLPHCANPEVYGA
jgi:glyoxylate reductase